MSRKPIEPRRVSLPTLLTEQEVSDVTRIPVRTIQDWRYRPPKKHAPMPFTRVGGRILYREDMIMRWLDDNTEALSA